MSGMLLPVPASTDGKVIRLCCLCAVDELKAISMDYGDPATTSQGWFTGPTRYFLPRGSLPLAEMAYLIDQHILQFGKSIDNGGRACFFQLLLSSTFGLAKHMCLPKLHVLLPGPRTTARPEFVPGLAGPALELQAVPPVDLALFLSTAAVLDCGTAVYILHQDQMDERILEACLQLAQHIACSRQPHADVLNVTKGSAAHQAVLEVIRPIVADNNDLRWRQLPLLHGFSTGEIEMGVEKAASCMVPRPSLCQWLRRQNVLLPPAAIGNQVK